ncbi:MAG: ATPase, T2SS/T4P/T4SS family [Lachnospiraceae bacterium]
MKEINFGPFTPYVIKDEVTDIDYNGEDLWITDLNKERYRVEEHGITNEFVEQFSHRIANEVNKPFNKMNNLLEAETEALRISIVHESVAISGRSICIRKSLPKVRMTERSILEEQYCQKEVLNLLIHCVEAKMNFIFCGEPGVGKTECAKFFSQYIEANQRVITIEDNPELRYREINPGKDCVELRIDEKDFGYSKAIKTSLRQNPMWIMLSEARSTEVKYLLENWSTGVNGFTTIHTDDVRKIPDRIQNMMESARDGDRLENDIYEFVHVGILIRRKKGKAGGVIRYIDQVCFFSREGEKNRITMIVEDGHLVNRELPGEIYKKMRRAEIQDPFSGKKGGEKSL